LVDELRRNLQLKGVAPVVSGEPASDLSRAFSVAYRRLLRDVLGKPENWESVTLVNALDILAEIWRRNYVRLDEEEVEEEEDQEEWESVIGAIEQAVHHPPAHWLERRRLGDVVERLYKLMGDVYPVAKRALTEEIQNLLSSEFLLGRGEEQAVLVAASLDIDHPQVSKTLNKLREDKSRWRRSQAAVTLITLGKEAGWQTLRTDLAGQFTELPKQTEEQRRGRKRAAYAAAMRLAEIVVYPPEKWSRARHVDIQELERHLSRKSLLEELATFPEAEPAGTDLVGKTLLSRLTDSSRRRDRFTWQYSCELICSLGCKKTTDTEGGSWCTQCFDKFEQKYFKSGEGPDRSAETCPAPRDKLPVTSGSVPAKPTVSSF
jgi:hypothetical protein